MAFPRSWLIVLVAVVAAVGACSSSSDPADGSLGEPTVEQVLADASAAMADVGSASFTIQQSGAEILIDDAGQLAFQSAEGRFDAPASADALINVEALGFTTEVGAIAIDGTLWFTNPLSGAWTEAPESFTFDPATLFDPEVGFPALLSEAAPSAEFVDDVTDQNSGSGKTRHHVRAMVAAERVSVLTGGLAAEQSEVDLWIDAVTSRVVEARFDLPVDDGVSSWQMTIGDYDSEVIIVAPELGSDG